MRPREAAGRLKMHPFAAEKAFAHATNFSAEELHGATVRLAALDVVTRDDRVEEVPERQDPEREPDGDLPLGRHDPEPPPLFAQPLQHRGDAGARLRVRLLPG